MTDFLTVGKILKAQGIKGEVKIVPLTDDPQRFKKLKTVFIGPNKPLNIDFLRFDDRFVYVKFAECNTRNDAEALSGKEILVERADAVKLPKGRYFIVDVVGCDAVLGGKVIGKVTDVNQNAPIDVYVIDDGKIMFPSAENVLEKVDVENKTITLNEEAFSRLAVYDNL